MCIRDRGDIFGAKKKKKRKVKQYNGAAIHSFNDLKIGDYVVHENHGLGIYPVSYTHLDVYKRQVIGRRIIRIPTICFVFANERFI